MGLEAFRRLLRISLRLSRNCRIAAAILTAVDLMAIGCGDTGGDTLSSANGLNASLKAEARSAGGVSLPADWQRWQAHWIDDGPGEKLVFI